MPFVQTYGTQDFQLFIGDDAPISTFGHELPAAVLETVEEVIPFAVVPVGPFRNIIRPCQSALLPRGMS